MDLDDDKEIITLSRKPKLKDKFSAFFANPKKRLWFIIVSGLILIGAVAAGLYFMTRPEPKSVEEEFKPRETVMEEPKYYGPLDGAETDSASSLKHPLAVMVENHIDARPQAGLDKASVVYEAIAEGGITRFMAVYGSREADKVGPVRSARPYYVDWAMGYNAWYAHVGGNYNALEQINSEKLPDLDQFKYPSSYWRDTSLRVSREHTMFTSTIKLREQAAKLSYPTSNNFRVYLFKDKDDKKTGTTGEEAAESSGVDTPSSPEEKTPVENTATTSATKINVNFSTANYNVAFHYNPSSDSYQRLVNGNVQKDRETKAELSPTNLIVMTVNRSPLVTKINEHGWNMTTVGEGSAKIFIGGKEIDARWVKKSAKEREVFYNMNGKEIVFNRGQFWLCVIPPESGVTFE